MSTPQPLIANDPESSPRRTWRWWDRHRRSAGRAVQIAERHVQVAGRSRSYLPGDQDSMLEAYLLLVRKVRRQGSDATITLRRDDVDVIAAHVGLPSETVIDRLGEMMGATRAQRIAMASLFASGALVIGLVGTAAAAPASGGAVRGVRDTARSADRLERSALDVSSDDDTMPLLLWPAVEDDELSDDAVEPATSGAPPIADQRDELVDLDLDLFLPADDASDDATGESASDPVGVAVEVGLPPVPPLADA